MIRLNDYLYSGDTVSYILQQYTKDLRAHAIETHSSIDMAHVNYLVQVSEILRHHNFLAAQSQKMKEFYLYIIKQYPFVAFNFKGRIKSLIRAESKFNGYVAETVFHYYEKNGVCPTAAQVRQEMGYFRDLIAYRIVISVPRYYPKPGVDREEMELRILYEIANDLPDFMEQRGFTVELAGMEQKEVSPWMDPAVRPYYRDYIVNTNPTTGYKSLHVTFFDNSTRCHVEVQLRTKEMDDYAEIGEANHFGYEKMQADYRSRRGTIPRGECPFFDEACDRLAALQELDLAAVDVNMFSARDNYLINDGCGLYRGRLILPYEHLSEAQYD